MQENNVDKSIETNNNPKPGGFGQLLGLSIVSALILGLSWGFVRLIPDSTGLAGVALMVFLWFVLLFIGAVLGVVIPIIHRWLAHKRGFMPVGGGALLIPVVLNMLGANWVFGGLFVGNIIHQQNLAKWTDHVDVTIVSDEIILDQEKSHDQVVHTNYRVKLQFENTTQDHLGPYPIWLSLTQAGTSHITETISGIDHFTADMPAGISSATYDISLVYLCGEAEFGRPLWLTTSIDYKDKVLQVGDHINQQLKQACIDQEV